MQDTDDIMSLSTTEGEGCNTPTHTSMLPDDLELPSYSDVSGVCPWKDTTYLIRDAETGLVIVLSDDALGLCPQEKGPGGGSNYKYPRGSHWHCVENRQGWLGFRNVVSGTYLDHNNKRRAWRLRAKADQHREWGWFCARQHPSGGHILLVKHWNGFQPIKVGGNSHRELLVGEEGDDATRWEFIKVDV